MANNKIDATNNIRQYLNILNEATVSEASIKDVASSVGTAVKAAAGSQSAKGKQDVKIVARYLQDQFKRYLSQTGLPSDEQTLMKFLVAKIGFTPENARKVLAKANIADPTKAKEEPQQAQQNQPAQAKEPAKKVTEAISGNDMSRAFYAAAQFAFANDLISDDDKEKIVKQNRSSGSDYDGRRTRSSSGEGNGKNIDKLVAAMGNKASSNLEKQADATKGQEQKTQDKANFSLNKAEFKKMLTQMGINNEQIADIIEVVHDSKNFKDLKTFMMPGIATDEFNKRLQKIGYAFFKAQNMDGFTEINEK